MCGGGGGGSIIITLQCFFQCFVYRPGSPNEATQDLADSQSSSTLRASQEDEGEN